MSEGAEKKLQEWADFEKEYGLYTIGDLKKALAAKDAQIGKLEEKIAEYHNAYEGKKHEVYEKDARIRELENILFTKGDIKAEALEIHFDEVASKRAVENALDKLKDKDKKLQRAEEALKSQIPALKELTKYGDEPLLTDNLRLAEQALKELSEDSGG